MKKIVLSIAAFCFAAGMMALAQPGGQMQGPPQEGNTQSFPTEEIAMRLTEQMSSELGLTDKQFKKLYKFNVQDVEKLLEFRANGIRPVRFGGQGGPGMGPGGQGGPGMGPGGQGGPGMGPGGQGGGRPGGPGMGPGGPGMGNPQGGERPAIDQDSIAEMEQYWANKEKKLRKILTGEQFDKWYTAHPEQFGIRVTRPGEGGPQGGMPGAPVQ